MKLRNKKTGEILDAVFYAPIGCYEITLWKDRDYLNPNSTHSLGVYKSLTELNADWEDYKPSEPLIKDEKIRKAVRAWADASGITKVLSYGDIFWLGFRSTNTESVWKFECNYIDGSKFQLDKEYTINELCGEEEE